MDSDLDMPKIQDTVSRVLRERYGDIFGEIFIQPSFNQYGFEVLLIDAVIVNKPRNLRKPISLKRHMRSALEEIGVEASPRTTFILKSELRGKSIESIRSY